MRYLPGRVLLLVAAFVITAAACEAQATCSQASIAGKWGYSYTGTIFTPSGGVPAASVGHFTQDAAGNVLGSQTRTVAGSSGQEDIAGSITVNRDCTATATINVYVGGVLQRSAVLSLVYDNNRNHSRGIFQSLTLTDGTNVPVVLAIDANRLFTPE